MTAVPEVVKTSEPFSFCQFHFIPPHFLWPPLQRPCGQLRECGGRECTPTSPPGCVTVLAVSPSELWESSPSGAAVSTPRPLPQPSSLLGSCALCTGPSRRPRGVSPLWGPGASRLIAL